MDAPITTVRYTEVLYQYMTSQELLNWLAVWPEHRMFWARPAEDKPWALLTTSTRGVQYGMMGWQFAGPVLPPPMERNQNG